MLGHVVLLATSLGLFGPSSSLHGSSHPPSGQGDQLPVERVQSVSDFIEDVEQRYRAYLVGKPADKRTALVALLADAEQRFGSSPQFQLAKYRYLNWLDEPEAALAAFAKVPDDFLLEPLDIANRLRRRLDHPQAALPLLRRLAAIDTPQAQRQLTACLHQDLAQRVAPVPRVSVQTPEFLELADSLNDPAHPKLAAASCGLRALVAAQARRGPHGLIEATITACDSPTAYPERYRLLIADMLARTGEGAATASAMRGRLMADVQRRLDGFDHGDVSQDELNERARLRYWVAYACYQEGQTAEQRGETERAERLLRAAARYSPDRRDLQERRYFYERVTLGGKDEYRSYFATFLENHGKPEEALAVRSELARLESSTLGVLRDAHRRARPEEEFADFWKTARLEGLPFVPDFDLATIEGTRIRLSSFRGRWVLLDFWGTWCSPCVAEMPRVEALHRESQARTDFRVVTVAARDTEESVKAFVKSRNLTMPVVMADDAVLRTFRVPFYPYKLLVAPNGRVVELGADDEWVREVRSYVFEELPVVR